MEGLIIVLIIVVFAMYLNSLSEFKEEVETQYQSNDCPPHKWVNSTNYLVCSKCNKIPNIAND